MKKQVLHIALLIAVAVIFMLTRERWINTMTECIASAILIALAGIPHGSLDHKIAEHRDRRFRLPLFLLRYLAAASFYLLVWTFAPGLAFVLFLVLTAWHFGETDFVVFGAVKQPGWLIFAYGWSLTAWLLGQDIPSLAYWLNIITRESSINSAFISFIAFLPVHAWFLVISIIILFNGAGSRYPVMVRCAFLVFLFALSKTSLLTGFILYFAGWHSMHALFHIKAKVYRRTKPSAMLREAIPMTALALACLGIVASIGNGVWLQNNGLPALFILLSILTLPHMTEMHRLYARKG